MSFGKKLDAAIVEQRAMREQKRALQLASIKRLMRLGTEPVDIARQVRISEAAVYRIIKEIEAGNGG